MIYICVYIYIYITYTFMYNKGNRIIFFKFLQCCAGLCIQQGKSAIVYVYSLPPQPSPPLPSPSLQVTTEHHIRLPGLQSNFSPASHLTLAHGYMSMLLPSRVLLSPSPTVHKSILYLCVSTPSLKIGSLIPFF